MFVTIRRYQGKPGQTEETVSRVKTGLLRPTPPSTPATTSPSR